MDETKLTTLRTEGLVKRYGKRTVANGVSINVKQGEIVGLLGPNGAGKTTSFYMTTGLVVPNEGHVYLDDTEITDYPVYKRARAGIGYLPQEASVFRKMSVEDNIMSVLEMTKLSHEQVSNIFSISLSASPTILWNIALCSLSTGNIETWFSFARLHISSPATTSVSLLARQIFLCALIAFIVGRNPENPTIDARTISIGSASTICSSADFPA